jgi:hypothetical protein
MYIGDPQTLPLNKVSEYLLKREEEKVNLFTDIFNQNEYPDPVSICTIKKKPLWKTMLDILDPSTALNVSD